MHLICRKYEYSYFFQTSKGVVSHMQKHGELQQNMNFHEDSYYKLSILKDTDDIGSSTGVYYNFYTNGDHETIGFKSKENEWESYSAGLIQNTPTLDASDFFVVCYPDPSQALEDDMFSFFYGILFYACLFLHIYSVVFMCESEIITLNPTVTFRKIYFYKKCW